MRAPAILVLAALLVLPGAPAAGLVPPGVLPDGVRVPHAQIRIVGDAAFEDPANGVVAGRGTADDPYVIAGWDILAVPGVGEGVRIEGTRAHVVLRDLAVHEGDPGYPTTYCRFNLGIVCQPTPLPPPAHGIVLVDARNVTLEGSDVVRNGIGVVLDRSEATFRDNTILGKAHPLDPSACFELGTITLPPPPLPRYMTLHGYEAAGVVAFDSEVRVESGTFGCTTAGVFGVRTPGDVRGARFHDAGYAVMFWDSTLAIEGIEVDRANFGVSFAHSVGTLRNSRIDGAQRGVWVCGYGGHAVVEDNVFRDGPGPDAGASAFDVGGTPGCPGAPLAELRRNVAGAGYAGVHWTDSPGVIEDNVFEGGHWYGIYTQFASPLIRNNTVEGYEQGVILRCHTGQVTGNTVTGNDLGLYVYHSGHPSCGPTAKPDVRGNALHGNAAWDLVNTEDMLYTANPSPGAVAVDARGTWWGSPAGPSPSQVHGAALVDPWATAP